MKRLFLLAFVCVFLFCNCAFTEFLPNEETVFTVQNYDLEITVSGYFKDVTQGSPFDLQLANQNAYLSIMAYKYIDLSEEQTPLDVYTYQNEDIFSKRDNVQVVEEETVTTLADKEIYKTRYSAEHNGFKNYYDSYLVDFKENETFAWVLISALPSYLEANGDALESMVHTIAYASAK